MDDKRITRTKRNLKNTLKKLMRRKPYADITVTELCKDAETSRITFYAHYNGKNDLADELVRDLFGEVNLTL
ncbi:MAG: TetR/AcrR family transcriptional regulator, partial [Clostridia bacterium]|nr:TetR/AcrR family transcriptional regulator [Clostridia bacterium]